MERIGFLSPQTFFFLVVISRQAWVLASPVAISRPPLAGTFRRFDSCQAHLPRHRRGLARASCARDSRPGGAQPFPSAFALSESYSACVIAPESSKFFAVSISLAGPPLPETERMY
jgi:hypothetical protein